MTANPALVQTYTGQLCPAPFAGEVFVLSRPKVGFELDGVQTRNGRWSSNGTAYLSNVRLVFVADKADASGLQAFDLPLVYVFKDKLSQPIFGCNNLAGEVWPAMPGGGPGGSLPPHAWKLSFKDGGMGTMYPLFYALLQRALRMQAEQQQMMQQQQQQQEQQQYQQAGAGPPAYPDLEKAKAEVSELQSKAFVDPSDPSTIYLTQPVQESQRLSYQPRYAANFGQDEKYQPM